MSSSFLTFLSLYDGDLATYSLHPEIRDVNLYKNLYKSKSLVLGRRKDNV